MIEKDFARPELVEGLFFFVVAKMKDGASTGSARTRFLDTIVFPLGVKG
jgi:hypothetical protein